MAAFRMFGRYRLLQQMAKEEWTRSGRSEKPVRPRVALKLIKGGSENTEIIGRFEAPTLCQMSVILDWPKHQVDGQDTVYGIGRVVGMLQYMSPEQAVARQTGSRSSKAG